MMAMHRGSLNSVFLRSASAALLASLLSAPLYARPIVFYQTATVQGDAVRLGDVADLTELPAQWQTLAAELTVGQLHASQAQVTVPVSSLIAAARRQVPALSTMLPTPQDPATITLVRAQPEGLRKQPQRAVQRCLQVTDAIGAGEAIPFDRVQPVRCPAAENGAINVTYDHGNRLARAPAPLAAGDITRDISPARLAHVRRGDSVDVTTTVGAVTVERAGRVVTDAANGHAAVLALGEGDAAVLLLRGQR